MHCKTPMGLNMKLLVEEPPLQVLPTLAVKIGLNEAIFLQQLHYWIRCSTVYALDAKWVYNTSQQWQEQFPFWSISTIERIIKNLRQLGLVTTVQLRKSEYNHTNYYTICYAKLDQIADIDSVKMTGSDSVKMTGSSIQENTQETTTRKKSIRANALDGFDDFWSAYPVRKAKAAAQKAWSKLTTEQRQKAIDVLPAHKSQQEWLKDNGQYIPHPATWLNQNRFDDELQIQQQQTLRIL